MCCVQVSRLSSPEVIYDASVESEADKAQLGELRRAAARLTEELTQQQMLVGKTPPLRTIL